MVQILESVDPNSLRLLHVEYPYTDMGTPLIPTPLPALVELYVNRVIQGDLLDSLTAPALEKFCIGPCIYATDQFGPELKRISPRLTYLRVEAAEEMLQEDPVLMFVHAYCGLTQPLEEVIEEPSTLEEGQNR